MGERESHPVWEVYDALRTARLNAEYFTTLLTRTKRKNRNLEILVAVAVPWSAVAALPVWHDRRLAIAWIVLTCIAAVASVAKPFLQLTEAVQSYEAAVARFRTVEADLAELRTEIAQNQDYASESRARYRLASRALYRAREIEPKEPLDDRLRRKLFDQVNRELPKESFFVPGD